GVRLDGLGAGEQARAEAAVGEPSGHQLEDVALPGRELVEWALGVRATYELRDALGVDRRAAAADPPHRVVEVVDLEHAVLEQVAEALRPLAHERDRVRRLHDLREQQETYFRVL